MGDRPVPIRPTYSESSPDGKQSADAIVVLTGGVGRVGEGLSLLERGLGKKLFVSGVYRGVDVQKLLKVAQQRLET